MRGCYQVCKWLLKVERVAPSPVDKFGLTPLAVSALPTHLSSSPSLFPWSLRRTCQFLALPPVPEAHCQGTREVQLHNHPPVTRAACEGVEPPIPQVLCSGAGRVRVISGVRRQSAARICAQLHIDVTGSHQALRRGPAVMRGGDAGAVAAGTERGALGRGRRTQRGGDHMEIIALLQKYGAKVKGPGGQLVEYQIFNVKSLEEAATPRVGDRPRGHQAGREDRRGRVRAWAPTPHLSRSSACCRHGSPQLARLPACTVPLLFLGFHADASSKPSRGTT